MILDEGMLLSETQGIDWHAVSEAEAARFGLSVGLWRDAYHTYEVRRSTALAVGGDVLVALAILVAYAGIGRDLHIAAAMMAVVLALAVRLGYLGVREHSARIVAAAAMDVAIRDSHALAEKHPDRDRQ